MPPLRIFPAVTERLGWWVGRNEGARNTVDFTGKGGWRTTALNYAPETTAIIKNSDVVERSADMNFGRLPPYHTSSRPALYAHPSPVDSPRVLKMHI